MRHQTRVVTRKQKVLPMKEFDDEDTLRLPATSSLHRYRKDSSGSGGPVGGHLTLPAQSPSEEDLFFDFDTIPRSKVVLPVLIDELEDKLRRPAVVRPPAA